MYRVSNDLRCTESKDGATVLDVQTGKIFLLNPTASLVLTRLGQLHTAPQIIRELCERFSAPLEQVRADVDELMDHLQHYGLVQCDTVEKNL
jgi:hypothetical protein